MKKKRFKESPQFIITNNAIALLSVHAREEKFFFHD